MKNLALLFILLSFLCNAQVIIPNATQQPAWVFPIYIEDAIGQKDTVYFGYDMHSDPCYGFSCPEIKFGEGYLKIDSTIMQAAIGYKLDTGGSYDSLYKVDIRDSFGFMSPASGSYELFIQNAHIPIKLSYTNQLLYSDSLPFPLQANLPRAQVAVDCFYTNNYIPNCPGLQLLITDTSVLNFCNHPDSVTVNSFGPNPSPFEFGVRFEPWNGISHTDIKKINNEELLKIYPNPSYNIVFVEAKNSLRSFEFKNLYGDLVFSKQLNGERKFELDFKVIPSGVYVIIAKTIEGVTIIERIINTK